MEPITNQLGESEPFIVYYEVDFKYQLGVEYRVQTNIIGYTIDSPFVSLLPAGLLIIRLGFGWDGASGPTIDTDTSMRGALVHDALYYLLRLGKLPQTERDVADEILSTICKEDGMYSLRANAWEFILEYLGGAAADPKNSKKLHIAPDIYEDRLNDYLV